MAYKCIVIAEDEYEGTFEFDSKEKRDGFVEGVSEGSGHYGGCCYALTRDDLPDAYEHDRELIEKHLPEDGSDPNT